MELSMTCMCRSCWKWCTQSPPTPSSVMSTTTLVSAHHLYVSVCLSVSLALSLALCLSHLQVHVYMYLQRRGGGAVWSRHWTWDQEVVGLNHIWVSSTPPDSIVLAQSFRWEIPPPPPKVFCACVLQVFSRGKCPGPVFVVSWVKWCWAELLLLLVCCGEMTQISVEKVSSWNKELYQNCCINHIILAFFMNSIGVNEDTLYTYRNVANCS